MQCLDLTDDPDLYGGFLLGRTKAAKGTLWSSGCFLSATWDADEVVAMKEAVVGKRHVEGSHGCAVS